MNVSDHYGWLILGMALVTYIPRWLPLVLLANRKLPEPLVHWLEYIPVCILSALLAPELLTTGTPRHLDPGSPALIAALPTFLVAYKTRSLGVSVIAGMVIFWAIKCLAGVL